MSGGARNIVVLAIGGAVLLFVLFYASTVDARPPSVTSFALTHPLGAAEDVALASTSLEVVFSEPVDRATAEQAFDIDPDVRGTFRWRGNAMGFTPDRPLPLDTEFHVVVAQGVRDAAGNVMQQEAAPFEFRTAGPPSVLSTLPGEGAVVGADAVVVLTFSTLMDTESVEDALALSPAAPYDLRWTGGAVRIQPREPLEIGADYELRLADTATDVAGLPLEEPFVLRFSVVDDALDVGWVMPADGLNGVSTVTPIAIAFQEPIDPASLEGALTFDPPIPGSFGIADPEGAAALREPIGQDIVRFQPAAPLPANTTFTGQLTGVRSRRGALLHEPLTWTFTTGVPSPSLQSQILFLSERAGVRNLWAMNPDGTNQRQLSAELSPVVEYAVSPDGDRFVIGDGARLIEQLADGGERRVLTDPSMLEFDPSYAPDGRKLAFGRADARTGGGLGIWTRDAGGDGLALLVPPDFEASLETASPAPSASAARGSPSAGVDGDGDDVESGEEPVALPVLRAPRYSPDGRWLAFVDTGGGVGTVLLETGVAARAPWIPGGSPAWTPASDRLLVSGVPPSAGVERQEPLPRRALSPVEALADDLPADAIRLAVIEPGETVARWLPLAQHATDPGFAGAASLVYRDPTFPGSLWTASADGGGPRRVAEEAALSVASFSPAPRGNRLVVATTRGLWLVSLGAGESMQLTPEGTSPTWVP